MNLPWNQSEWSRIAATENLHHGLMISGVSGVGKREFCLSLGQYLLCDQAVEGTFCGQCQNCRLFAAGTHPDFHLLTSELENATSRLPLVTAYSDRYQDIQARERKAKPGQIIPINQVRTLIDRFLTHPHIADRKVALIMPAEVMNANAANALLKLLEEPPGNSFLLLMSSTPGFLPATIRSRCMTVDLPTPVKSEARRWLTLFMKPNDADRALSVAVGPADAKTAFENGLLEIHSQYLTKILALVENNQDAVKLAREFSQSGLAPFLYWFQRFICELLTWRVGATPPLWAKRWRIDSKLLPVNQLYSLYDRINFYRQIVREPINEQMAIEDLMLSFWRATRKPASKNAMSLR